MLRVYVAGPYTQGDIALNVRNAIQAGDDLLRMGYTPFIPHLTHFWHMLYPHMYERWMEWDMQWLAQCECLVRLEGESAGADREVGRAKGLGIPVFYGMNAFFDGVRR